MSEHAAQQDRVARLWRIIALSSAVLLAITLVLFLWGLSQTRPVVPPAAFMCVIALLTAPGLVRSVLWLWPALRGGYWVQRRERVSRAQQPARYWGSVIAELVSLSIRTTFAVTLVWFAFRS
jgi:hypothetical protein